MLDRNKDLFRGSFGDLIGIEWTAGAILVVYWNEKGLINRIKLCIPE